MTMTSVLILGASGQIAKWVIESLAARNDTKLTLLLRDPKKISGNEPANAKLAIGDVLDKDFPKQVMPGHEVVYANLTGEDLDIQARAVISTMRATGVKRLIFVLSLGIYDEVPGKFGEWNNAAIGEALAPFRRAADAIEASGLDYTLLRPAWLTDEDEVDYELTERHEPFKGTVVSRKSVSDLVVRIIASPSLHVGANLGVNKPDTDGEKPYFI
nr:SDR family oxidoreductase [Caballeronia sp. ATUFL_M2_KS44]